LRAGDKDLSQEVQTGATTAATLSNLLKCTARDTSRARKREETLPPSLSLSFKERKKEGEFCMRTN